jgi:hypothetical protein
MPRVATYGILTATALLLFVGCDRLWPDVYWRSERYVLVAIDAKGQMNLSFDERNGTTEGLVGATVFSIGANEMYIVVQQHPETDGFGHFDRSITNYFVVERTLSPSWTERKKGVRGPLTKKQFQELASTLSLPGFTKTFNDLR